MAKPPCVGIDFGTTKTVCAVYESGHVRLLPGQDGKDSTPSCVLHRSGEWFVGWRAREHSGRFSGDYDSISSVKRKMGRSGEESWGSLKGYPQQVAAYILAAARREAERALGRKFTEVVLAVPAHFHAIQRRATKEAAEIAGLQALRLINEATAAAIAWSHREGAYSERTVAVFDFGGGTLDVSVVQCDEGVYEVVGTAGDGNLGGDDIDRLLWRHISDQQQALYGSEKVTLGRGSLTEGLEIAEQIKIDLSGCSQVERRIPGFVRVGNAYHDLHYSLSRPEFEKLLPNFADRARAVYRRAVEGCPRPDLVILIGGTSHIPYVQRVIKEEAKRETVLAEGELVATGAALYAAMLAGSEKEVVLLDVVPATLGVAISGGAVLPLISRGTTIPGSKTKAFTTTEDEQASVDIEVCVGEAAIVDGNVRLGRLRLAVPPGPKGSKQIDVTFSVDSDQVLNVTVKDKATGLVAKAQIDSPYALNAAQRRKLRSDIETWEKQGSLSERVCALSGKIDRLLTEWASRIDQQSERELRGMQDELMAAPSDELALRAEQRVGALEVLTEVVSGLEGRIRQICAEWRAEWGCEPTMISQAPELLDQQLRHGTLRTDLTDRITKDIARHTDAIREAKGLRNKITVLTGSVEASGGGGIVAEARQWFDGAGLTGFTSAEYLEAAICSGKRSFVRLLTRVFVLADRPLQARLSSAFSQEIREHGRRISNRALAVLATGTGETKWRALGALDALALLGKGSLRSTRVSAVMGQLTEMEAWEMRALVGACLQQMAPDAVAELCVTTPQIRAWLLADPSWVEFRLRTVSSLRVRLARPNAAREDVQALVELSPEEDALLSILDCEMSSGARGALYELLGQTPRSKAVRPLLFRIPHEAKPLRQALLDCLRSHVQTMTGQERKLFLLGERSCRGDRLSLRDRMDLHLWRLFRQRGEAYADLVGFLLKRSGRAPGDGS